MQSKKQTRFVPKVERRERFFSSPLGRRLLSEFWKQEQFEFWNQMPALKAIVDKVDARGIQRVGEWFRGR